MKVYIYTGYPPQMKKKIIIIITITLWNSTHNSGLIAMVTVTGDIFPAPALQQRIFITMAAKTFKVEETRSRSKVRVPKRSADFTVGS